MTTSGLTPRSHAHHFGPTRHEPHYLYRCYDADDVLLYIGCTVDVQRRMSAHRRGKGPKASQWLAACMDRYETDGPFRGRDAGRAAEKAAINDEQPLFNYQERANEHQAAWMTRDAIGRYLVLAGHVELAERTACTCDRGDREAERVSPWCAAHNTQARGAA